MEKLFDGMYNDPFWGKHKEEWEKEVSNDKI